MKSVKFEKPAGSSSFPSSHTDLFFIQSCSAIVLLWHFFCLRLLSIGLEKDARKIITIIHKIFDTNSSFQVK